MTTTCTVGCGQPAEGMCSHCWATLSGALGAVEWLAMELDTVLSRQAKIGGASVGVVVRMAEQPLPIHLGASDRAHQLRSALSTWVRDLHDLHAVRWQQCDTCGATWTSGDQRHDAESCPGPWREQVDPLACGDTLSAMAAWILRHPTWVRSHLAAEQLHHDLTRAIDASWRVVDRPPDSVYLGICSADIQVEDGMEQCQVDLYAVEGQDVVRCWSCRTDHVTADRRRALATAVEDQVVETRVLVGLVGALGQPLTSAAIRNLRARGRIQPKVRGEDGYIRLKQPEDTGPDRFRVGDVLDRLAENPRRREAKALREAS